MATVDPATITTRIDHYDRDFPTLRKKRELAMTLITPGAEIPAYDTLKQVRYQLSILWALRTNKIVRDVASHLWGVLPAANEFVGEQAIIFQHGNKEAARQLKYGSYITMLVGELPADDPPMHHAIRGKLNPAAEPLLSGIRAPYAHGVASLPLLHSRRLSIDYSEFTLGNPATAPVDVPVFEATAELGENTEFAANPEIVRARSEQTADITMHPMLAGNVAVANYLRLLAEEASSRVGVELLHAFDLTAIA